MIKIEIPANRPDIAAAMGRALLEIGTATVGFSEVKEAVVTATASTYALPVETLRDSSEDDESSAVPPADTATAFSPAANPRVDLHGVPFDERYCANAQDPFYATGKQSGQWKKRKGVSEEAYSAWYDTALSTSAPVGSAATEEQFDNTPPANTAAAFGGAQQNTVKRPATTGEYMAWVSEKQAAGKLTQPMIQAAYQQLGLGVTSLFPPTPADVVASHIANLYDLLSQVAGA